MKRNANQHCLCTTIDVSITANWAIKRYGNAAAAKKTIAESFFHNKKPPKTLELSNKCVPKAQRISTEATVCSWAWQRWSHNNRTSQERSAGSSAAAAVVAAEGRAEAEAAAEGKVGHFQLLLLLRWIGLDLDCCFPSGAQAFLLSTYIMDKKSSPVRRQKRQAKVIEENFWDCSVCTYRNSAEAFKCRMCDVRKGEWPQFPFRIPRFPRLPGTRSGFHFLDRLLSGFWRDLYIHLPINTS